MSTRALATRRLSTTAGAWSGLLHPQQAVFAEPARAVALALLSLAWVAPSAQAQPANRFQNPEFDDVLTPWVSTGGLSAIDADSCPGSGSANAPFSMPVLFSYVAQCVAVTAGETLHAAMQARSSRAFVAGTFRFTFVSGPDCAGTEVQTIDTPIAPLDTTWQRFHGSVTVPVGASSAAVYANFGSVLSPEGASIWADRAWLGTRPLLFFDGFENTLTCRWSAAISE